MFNLMPLHVIKAPYNLSVHLLTFSSLSKNVIKPTNSCYIILHLRVSIISNMLSLLHVHVLATKCGHPHVGVL